MKVAIKYMDYLQVVNSYSSAFGGGDRLNELQMKFQTEKGLTQEQSIELIEKIRNLDDNKDTPYFIEIESE